MIDHQEVIYQFLDYAKEYNDGDNGIERKSLHSLRVARISELIASGLNMSDEDVDLAWFIGILHDTGRFEQQRRYRTFVDRFSIDHAEFGADILFRDGVIGLYPTQTLPAGWKELCETAVRSHNKLCLPDGLDPRTRIFCQLIRDADKTDIFRVIATTSFEERVGTSVGRYSTEHGTGADPEVMACVYGHRCVPGKYIHSVFDSHIAKCCLAFELDFEESRRIIREQGFLQELLQCRNEDGSFRWNEAECRELEIVRQELESAWGAALPVLH